METTWAVTDDGVRLPVQVTGPPDAPAVLLLAGQANSHAWWRRVRGGLETDLRTITLDYRGTGASEAAAGSGGSGAWDGWRDWSTSLFAADAVAALDAVGVPRAHVYGTSMGGRVAQLLAIEHPDRVDRLVLACTSPGGRGAHERGAEVRRVLSDADPAVRRAALLDLMYTPAWAAAHGATSPLLGDPDLTPEATRGHLRVSARHDAASRLGEIVSPTLVLHGSDDAMSPVANLDLIADAVPGAARHVVHGGRHGFFEERADEVSPLVVAFLQGRGGGVAG